MFQIIKKDFFEFLSKYWPPLLSCVISFGLSFFENDKWYWKLIILLIPWVLCCLILFPELNRRRESEIAKLAESKNKEMPENMIRVQKLVEKYLSHEEDWNSKEYSKILTRICDEIRSLYVVKGDHTLGYDKFSVSIKEIQGEADNRKIREICRDCSSASVVRKITALNAPYPLDDNTPYKVIVEKYENNSEAMIFVETDVHDKIRKGEYKCTRSFIVGEEHVPYKSVCVSPILPLINPNAQNQIRGFICVDSEATGCFKKNEAANTVYHEFMSGLLYKLLEVQSRCVKNQQSE